MRGLPYKAEAPSLTRGATLAKYTVTPARASDTLYELPRCCRARDSISPTLYKRMPPSLEAGATLPRCCHLRTVESLTCTPARISATRVARVRGSRDSLAFVMSRSQASAICSAEPHSRHVVVSSSGSRTKRSAPQELHSPTNTRRCRVRKHRAP